MFEPFGLFYIEYKIFAGGKIISVLNGESLYYLTSVWKLPLFIEYPYKIVLSWIVFPDVFVNVFG